MCPVPVIFRAGLCIGAGEAVFNVTTINGSVPPTQFAVPSPADSERFFADICTQGQAQGMGGTFEIDFLSMQFLQVLGNFDVVFVF